MIKQERYKLVHGALAKLHSLAKCKHPDGEYKKSEYIYNNSKIKCKHSKYKCNKPEVKRK